MCVGHKWCPLHFETTVTDKTTSISYFNQCLCRSCLEYMYQKQFTKPTKWEKKDDGKKSHMEQYKTPSAQSKWYLSISSVIRRFALKLLARTCAKHKTQKREEKRNEMKRKKSKQTNQSRPRSNRIQGVQKKQNAKPTKSILIKRLSGFIGGVNNEWTNITFAQVPVIFVYETYVFDCCSGLMHFPFFLIPYVETCTLTIYPHWFGFQAKISFYAMRIWFVFSLFTNCTVNLILIFAFWENTKLIKICKLSLFWR